MLTVINPRRPLARFFQLLVSLILAALVLAACSVLPGYDESSQQARRVTELSSGWRFQFGEQPDAVTEAGFDDSAWQEVTIPHSWNRIGEYRLERSEEANAEQGVGWYRLVYPAETESATRRQYLDFGAVGTVADVWVNGEHVGQHRGAFSRFRFDVTDAWKPGEPNLIVVKADNSRPAAGSSTEHVIPLSGDFFVHGGIYRDAALISAHEAGIDLLDYGGPGIYARAQTVEPERAVISLLSRLRNSGESARQVDVRVAIRDRDGKRVARTSRAVTLPPGGTEAELEVAIDSPRLWDGRRDPYLYTITAAVYERGKLLDRVSEPLGVRSFRFDAENGFFLNGRHLKLHGVSRHQGRYAQGWALTAKDHAEDMDMIVELGANTVRHAHYQHADEWSAEADRAGMVVWAEVPYVTTPSLSGGKGSQQLWDNAEQQARELIRQNYNHPSILMWAIGNEVDSAKGFGMAGAPPRPKALLQHLQQVVKEEDPYRPTIYADCCENTGMVETAGERLVGVADLIGYNRYFGWYYPQPLQAAKYFGEHLDHLHNQFPNLPMSISEYGAGGAPSQFSDNVRAGALNFTGRPQPNEYLSFVHEQTWPEIAKRDFVFASWVWNMFDFTSNLRKEGDSIDINTKGLVTFDRKIKKDAFYYYKAQWNPEPMIHLTGKRYRQRAYPRMDVKAYTNADKASLSWNGASVGEVECVDGICLWPGVTLRPGDNRADVSARVNGIKVHDHSLWVGPSRQTGIRIDAGSLAGQVVDDKHFGSDHFVTGGSPRLLNRGGFAGRRMGIRSVDSEQPALFDHWREGAEFSYAIPVANGNWQVTIHTFDPASEPRDLAALRDNPKGAPQPRDKQVLSVSANGKTVIRELDVQSAAGGTWKGVSRSFVATVKEGVLRLDFSALSGEAVIAAIELQPAAD